MAHLGKVSGVGRRSNTGHEGQAVQHTPLSPLRRDAPLAADRVQTNTLRRMPPFLLLLWDQILIVSPSSVATLRAVYVAIRATYPFFSGRALHGNFPQRAMFNTFRGDGVLSVLVDW